MRRINGPSKKTCVFYHVNRKSDENCAVLLPAEAKSMRFAPIYGKSSAKSMKNATEFSKIDAKCAEILKIAQIRPEMDWMTQNYSFASSNPFRV
jgi:hypothetical protein